MSSGNDVLKGGIELTYTATQNCELYITYHVPVGNSLAYSTINDVVVTTIGHAWTATNPSGYLLPCCYKLRKGDVFCFYQNTNSTSAKDISVHTAVVMY